MVRSATQLVVTSQLTAVTAGQPFSLSVAAEDPNGNVDPEFDSTVTVGLTNGPPGGDALGGLFNSETMLNGVASFTGLQLYKAFSSDTLLLACGGLPTVTTNPFPVRLQRTRN